MRYDAATDILWVAAGGDTTDGYLYAIAASVGIVLGRVPTDGHAEGFQISAATGLLFVSMPHVKARIGVVNLSTFAITHFNLPRYCHAYFHFHGTLLIVV